jgi:hypothetical protein
VASMTTQMLAMQSLRSGHWSSAGAYCAGEAVSQLAGLWQQDDATFRAHSCRGKYNLWRRQVHGSHVTRITSSHCSCEKEKMSAGTVNTVGATHCRAKRASTVMEEEWRDIIRYESLEW